MVRHQERAAERADHLYLVPDFEIADVVGGDAPHRVPLMILGHTLHGEGNVVVAGALTIAWAGYRVLPRHMSPATFIDTRRTDPDRLAFEHGERHIAEVEHDMMCLAGKAGFGAVKVAYHRRGGWLLGSVEVGIGMRSRPRRQRRAELRRVEHRLTHH